MRPKITGKFKTREELEKAIVYLNTKRLPDEQVALEVGVSAGLVQRLLQGREGAYRARGGMRHTKGRFVTVKALEERVRALRAKGVTIEATAEDCLVSTGTVQNIMKGEWL